MTQKLSETDTLDLKASGEGGQLARQDFTPERVRAYAQLAAQVGDGNYLSEDAREETRQAILNQYVPGSELWVFGYGSLMWNPAIHVRESLPTTLHGFSRRFAMRLVFGRAMPDKPGLMLCLIPGGSCRGIAHCIAPDSVESETKILWMREMLSGAYTPTWVDLDLGGRHVRGITFVMNQAHSRYLPDLEPHEKAARIAVAEGPLGSNRDYLFRTASALIEAGIQDPYIDDMNQRVRALVSPSNAGEKT